MIKEMASWERYELGGNEMFRRTLQWAGRGGGGRGWATGGGRAHTRNSFRSHCEPRWGRPAREAEVRKCHWLEARESNRTDPLPWNVSMFRHLQGHLILYSAETAIRSALAAPPLGTALTKHPNSTNWKYLYKLPKSLPRTHSRLMFC